MKISSWWLLLALIIGIFGAVVFYKCFYIPGKTVSINTRSNYDVITLALPKDSDPTVFGPKYWDALHTIVERIPCPACQMKAVPFMSFFHDVVNKNTGKPLFDKENYNQHIDNICKLPKA